MPRAGSPYSGSYARRRAALIGRPCSLRLPGCTGVADSADHRPPLRLHAHVQGSGCCELVPACLRCQKSQGGRLSRRRGRLVTSRVW